MKAKKLQKRCKDNRFVPWGVEIELTNGCNLECVFCPNPEHDRVRGVMSLDTFMCIADNIIALEVPEVIISGFGEPTLDKRIIEKLSYLKKNNKRSNIMLVSNGLLFNKEMLDIICSEQLVDIISISVDAGDEYTYKKIHKQKGILKIKENLEYLKELKIKNGFLSPRVDLRYKDFYMNKGQFGKFMSTFSGVTDEVSIYANIANWPGAESKCDTISKTDLIKVVCPSIYDGMRINWNGDVIICPQDYQAKSICGNINEDSMVDIWNGVVLSKYRDMHEKFKFKELDVCKDCDINTHMLVPF